MQCSSCGFENMPGSDDCCRCGTSMRLATAVMDVQPLRAGKVAKRLRRIVPAPRAYFGVRDGLKQGALSAGARGAAVTSPWLVKIKEEPIPAWPLLWRLLVPGWSHFYARQVWRGRLFLWGFVATLLPGLLFM